MRKVLLLTVCTLFLTVGWVQAWQYEGELDPGNSSNVFTFIRSGNSYTAGGGSFGYTAHDASTLSLYAPINKDLTLDYLFCIDIFHTISLTVDYDATLVRNDGKLFNGTQAVPNAGQVAWLLDNYAQDSVDGIGDDVLQQKALQAALWRVVNNYDDGSFRMPLSTEAGYNAALNNAYNAILADLNGKSASTIENYFWITPMLSGRVTYYQGLIGYNSYGQQIPEPSTLLLVGLGLVGLGYLRKR